MKETLYGYTGNLLRADLSTGQITIERLDAGTLRKFLGGAGIGLKLLYDEVPPGYSVV